MAMMPGSAYKARQDMIARMKGAWHKSQGPKADKFKQDEDAPGARSTPKDAREARDLMIARITGKPISKKGTGAYREDSADPLAWYRAHLAKEGWSPEKINMLLAA